MGISVWLNNGNVPVNAAADFENFKLLGGGHSIPTLTISGGVISVTGAGIYLIDTEGGATSDELTRINGALANDLIELWLVSASRQIFIQHGSFLKMENGTTFVMDSANDYILFRSRGSDVCHERKRGNIPA